MLNEFQTNLSNMTVTIPPVPHELQLQLTHQSTLYASWKQSQGELVERGQTICSLNIHRGFLAHVLGKGTIPLEIKSPVKGRILSRCQAYGSNVFCDHTAVIQLFKGEVVPPTTEPVFADFRQVFMNNWDEILGRRRYPNDPGSASPATIQKCLDELIQYRLTAKTSTEMIARYDAGDRSCTNGEIYSRI